MATLKVIDSKILYEDLSMMGHNLKTLSLKVGVTEQYLSSVLNGRKNPSPVLAKKISQELDKEIRDYFFVVGSCKS